MSHHYNSVSLASIVIDERFQTRSAMDQGAIADYVDAIRQAGHWPFPPIKIVSQFLVDGFHRIEAVRKVNAAPDTPADLRKALQSIPCERVPVDLSNNNIPDLALRHALGANHTHGLRRSHEDKRRSVELAIKQWSTESNRQIASLTGTTHPFVAKVRAELQVVTLPHQQRESTCAYAAEVETLPPVETLQLVIEKLKLGEGLEKFHFDAQGELIGHTLIAFLNFKDPFKRYQIFDWNGQSVAYSQWGSVSRLLWVLNQLRPDLVAADFDHNGDVREIMEMSYKDWASAQTD